MALSFLYVAFVRILQLIRLLRRDKRDLAVEVMALRHEVVVLRRLLVRPAVRPSDRALLAGLSRLLSPDAGKDSSSGRRRCFAGIATWYAGVGRTHAEHPADQGSLPAPPGLLSNLPGKTQPGAIGESTGKWPLWAFGWLNPVSGPSCVDMASSRHRGAADQAGRSSSKAKPHRYWLAISSQSTRCCYVVSMYSSSSNSTAGGCT